MTNSIQNQDLTPSEQSVAKALIAHELDTQIKILDKLATTAQMAADALGIDVGQIVKSLCFSGAESNKPYLLLVSGANRVHENRSGRLIGEKLKRADADFVKQHTGLSIGGVSPFGHPTQLDIFIDEDLLSYPTVWAAAGNPRSVFEIKPDELVRSTNGTVICVK